eukprot:546522_1
MGNAYVSNTVQLIEAITDDKADSKETKKCFNCYCVPDYIALLHGHSPTSPIAQQKPRKLIRNSKHMKQHKLHLNAPVNDLKQQFLPIPTPIMVEESYCSFSDGSSLDLSIAAIEFSGDNDGSVGNSSYDTIDINPSNQDENNDNHAYELQIQHDIIHRNVLYISNEYMKQINGDLCDQSSRNIDVCTLVYLFVDYIANLCPKHSHKYI